MNAANNISFFGSKLAQTPRKILSKEARTLVCGVIQAKKKEEAPSVATTHHDETHENAIY